MFKRTVAIVFILIIASGVTYHSLSAETFGQTQSATRAREVNPTPVAEVTVTLNEPFFNSLLDVVFTRLKAPSFPLSITRVEPKEIGPSHVAVQAPELKLSHAGLEPDTCESVVILEREKNGVKTAVRFEDGRVVAPLAFRGSYSVALIGCIHFEGWADTVVNLDFDKQRQVLSARVTVVDIKLSNVPSLASGVVVSLVQSSIDRRINPIEILQATQLSARIPIAGSGGAIRMRAMEIRPEVTPGAVKLHIFYEFAPAD